MTVSYHPRHPAAAAALSFLFPGLGQAYAGQRRIALLLAGPIVLLIAATVLIALIFGAQMRNQLLSAPFLTGLLALDVALLNWRLFAILHAGLSIRPSTRTLFALGGLVLLTLAMHAYMALVVGRLDSVLNRVFGAERTGVAGTGSGEGGPLNEPAYRWSGTDPINFLLLGLDTGPGRNEANTDTILVVSVDPVAHHAVMVSVPRDTGYVPLPDTRMYPDGLFPGKINALAQTASQEPQRWCPDLRTAADCGIRTLERSVSLYLGIPIHQYALIDLQGFAELIDSLGGLELCLPGKLTDPAYRGPGWLKVGIELPAGCRHYDGAEALAFARIRQGRLVMPDGSVEAQDDFKRSERQQEVLLALRRQLAQADLLFDLPGILDAIGRTVTTDFPRSKAGDLATLMPLIAGPEIERVVLGLPKFVDPPVDPATNYLLIPRRDSIRAEMERLFGRKTPLLGWYLGSKALLPPPGSEQPTPSPS
ncbi:MAG: LCP family protein [Chloroflexota bacterium]|nr:LCP family protein [Chloroflexota bacterium]